MDTPTQSVVPRPRNTRRVKTPTVIQMESVECGAAALAMVLGYHGRFEPLPGLRIACGVSRDGSKASHLLKAARGHGLTAKGFKREVSGLQDLPLPAILFWNFNHFVVLEGFRKGRAYLNDPASGPRVVDAEDFDEAFTGVVLTFEPGPDFTRGDERPGLFPGLAKRLRGSETALAYLVLTGLGLVVPGLAIPTFSRIFVDDILIGASRDWFRPLLLGMGLTLVLRTTLTWLQAHTLLRMSTKLALAHSSRFFWHVLRLPMEFYAQRFAGEIGARVAINDRVAALLSGELATTVISVVTVAFYAIVMLSYDVGLAILGITFALINVLALRYVSRRRVDENKKLARARGQLEGASMGGLQMMEDLKATGAESDFFAEWSGRYAKTLNAEQRLGVLTVFLMAVPPLLEGLNIAAVLAIGGLRVMEGAMSIGMLVAFQTLMASFTAPVQQLVELGTKVQEMEEDINRLDDVLRNPVDPAAEADTEAAAPATMVQLVGHLELRNVTFGYSRLSPPLLKAFDLTLKPGARVALVGRSGSGKSTVAKLVAGLYQPWEGDILFDGKRRDDIPRSVLHNSLSLVDQDIFLFGGTIRENLTMWDSTVSDRTVVEAGRDACIHDDIVVRGDGYDGLASEAGANFSGGQRQRLEIARALVTRPTLLILDEATSALDANTEKLIDDHLRRRGCTCLIVAHRLSTIRDCDEIIMLERGKVVERGTHEELITLNGAYAQMIAA